MNGVTLATMAACCVWVSACGGLTGQRIFRNGGCANCHGYRLQGGRLAPSLKGLEGRWSRKELKHFLRDPLGYKDRDRRLKAMAKRYPAPMPPILMGKDEMDRLVSYLMEASRETK